MMPHPPGALVRLLGFMRPFAGWVALSVLLGVATVASGVALLGTSAYLIAYAALQPSVAALQVAIVGVRFFGISRAVFRYLERLVSHSVNFRLLAALRGWFYRLIEPLAPARLLGERSADLLNRAIADIETLENFYVRAVAPPVVALIIVIGVGLFVARYDARAALLLVTALLVVGLLVPLLVHILARRSGREVIERRADLHAFLLDALQGMPDLLAFGQHETQLRRIDQAGRAMSAAQVRQSAAGALGNALGLLVSGLALWGLLLLAIPLVGRRIDGITLAMLALVTLATFEAVTPLSQAAQHLESSLSAARRLFGLVEARPEVVPPANPLAIPVEPLNLRIRGLAFRYAGDRALALDGLELDLSAGKRVALVGPSGAGKSTLVQLLLRFWEPDAGDITLNGQPINCFDPDALRRQMSVIGQSTYLFSGTLRQNLLLASPGAGEDQIDRALIQAQLTTLVMQLPSGLDTWVGERGLQLSGGERQRVAVARALLRGAPLWLFDEPTANLDATSEQALLEVFRRASQGRTVLYITHRLVGLEDMDEILVLSGGRIVERGEHTTLLRSGGLYAQMQRAQSRMLE